MPNTYTQLFIQVVFAVKGREAVIPKANREVLHKYITAVLQTDGHKMLAVFCMPDHIHILVGLNPAISISDMILDVKRASTNFINENNLIKGKFNWQKGYGAFSYSKSQLQDVVNYVLNQEAHHQNITFLQEFMELLKEHSIEFDQKYFL